MLYKNDTRVIRRLVYRLSKSVGHHDRIKQVKLLTIKFKCKDIIYSYLSIRYLMVLTAAHLYSIPLRNYYCKIAFRLHLDLHINLICVLLDK